MEEKRREEKERVPAADLEVVAAQPRAEQGAAVRLAPLWHRILLSDLAPPGGLPRQGLHGRRRRRRGKHVASAQEGQGRIAG